MVQLSDGITLFLSLLVEAMPFLLLGVIFSSALLLFVDERQLVATLPKQPVMAAFAGSLVGFLFPVCECGNVPVARRLMQQGAPTALAISFLLAAPTINPIVVWATWFAFRDQPEIVVFRVLFTLVVAVVTGLVFSTQEDMRPFVHNSLARAMPVSRSKPDPTLSPLLQSGTFLMEAGKRIQLDAPEAQALALPSPPKEFSVRLRLMLENMVLELRELGAVLVIGSAIAAFVQVAIPREIILSLGQGPVTSIIAMMALAWIVSICSTVDSFFALSFASVFTTGSLLGFLVFGPMIDLKNISLLLTVFKPRAMLYLFLLAAQITFILTLVLNLYWS